MAALHSPHALLSSLNCDKMLAFSPHKMRVKCERKMLWMYRMNVCLTGLKRWHTASMTADPLWEL